MHSDLTSGLRLPAYTAFAVVQGTIDSPEEVVYLYKDDSEPDGVTATSFTSLADFQNNGYYIVARLYIDNVNNTSYLIYNNPNKGTARLDFHTNA